jgi:hypothetical protein
VRGPSQPSGAGRTAVPFFCGARKRGASVFASRVCITCSRRFANGHSEAENSSESSNCRSLCYWMILLVPLPSDSFRARGVPTTEESRTAPAAINSLARG